MTRVSLSGRRRSYSATSLPPISEDNTFVESLSPPPYSFESEHNYWAGKLPPKHEPDRTPGDDEHLQPKGWIGRQLARRGGWFRFLIAFTIIIVLFALGVGLGVGLSKRKSNDASAQDQTETIAGQQAPEKPFPEGSYRFETVLESIGTDCTSESSTYRCYPYSTYLESPDSSVAVFDWIIEAVDSSSNAYQISSSKNPFSIVFTNATLDLEAAGTEEEHFSFSVPLNATVIPDTALSIENTNGVTTCYYSTATFSASIYTKKAKSWPPAAEETTAQLPRRWPYAARMKQAVMSASNVPNCVDAAGLSVGDFSVKGTGECSCAYANFGI